MQNNFPEDMIGAIKIKDGLFIGDSFAAQVSANSSISVITTLLFPNVAYLRDLFFFIGPRICGGQQGDTYHQLRRQTGSKPLGRQRCSISYLPVVGPWESNNFRRKRYNNKSNLRLYWECHQEVWVGTGPLRPRAEPIIFRSRSLLHAQVPLVHAQNLGVSQLASARSWDPWNFHLTVAIIWAKVV